jgi:hypothetical protein
LLPSASNSFVQSAQLQRKIRPSLWYLPKGALRARQQALGVPEAFLFVESRGVKNCFKQFLKKTG